jgi:hypothetical protein
MLIKKILIPLIILFLSTNVLALEYSVTVNSPSSVNAYEGDKISNKFSAIITNAGSFCDISCGWATSAGNGDGIKVALGGGTNTFYFDVNADGSGGIASYQLIITCDRISTWNCWSEQDQRNTGSRQFRFLWNGDDICTTEREKCENYNQFLKDNACSCSSGRECKPNGNRNDIDERGCQTFCGNNIVEKQYENCNNCPNDVGRCDGTSCIKGSECEGKYCVHNVCNALPYRVGDNYCDNNVGETCKNSGSDCACGNNLRCSNTGVCETFCGNEVCEASEQGICKADCLWCGDGTCEASESCSSCEVDCGACKKPTKEEELQRNIQTKEVQTNKTTQNSNSINNEQNTVNLFGKYYNSTIIVLVAIALFVFLTGISFFIYKKVKSNKKEDKKNKKHNLEKKEHDKSTISRCVKCNKKIDEDAKFCHHCGHKLK